MRRKNLWPLNEKIVQSIERGTSEQNMVIDSEKLLFYFFSDNLSLTLWYCLCNLRIKIKISNYFSCLKLFTHFVITRVYEKLRATLKCDTFPMLNVSQTFQTFLQFSEKKNSIRILQYHEKRNKERWHLKWKQAYCNKSNCNLNENILN